MRVPALVLALSAAAVACSGLDDDEGAVEADPSCVPTPPEDPAARIELDGDQPWNALVISIDTLRLDHVIPEDGASMAPLLADWMAESLALDDFRACSSWTYASMLCFFSGRTNVALGLVPSPGFNRVSDDAIDLAPRWFGEAGYVTRLVSASAYVSQLTPIGTGFDAVSFLSKEPAEGVAASALSVLDDLDDLHPDEPWYLQVHFTDPHTPYIAPERYLGGLEGLEAIDYDLSDANEVTALGNAYDSMTSDEQALVQQHVAVQYQAEVAYLDDELSAFWQALAERGALDRTLVLLLSDHGEQFWEHGEFRHAKSLHPGESDAIAAFWWNGVQPGHWSGATEQPDLLPTLFGALDISPPDGFTGQVLGRASPGRYRTALLASTVDSPSIAVDRNGLRLHYQWDGDRALFDLTADPAEQNDVYGSWNEESACLWDKVADEVEAARAWIDWEEPRQLTP